MWLSPHIIVISNCQPQRFDSESEKVPEALCQFKINPVITGQIVLLQKQLLGICTKIIPWSCDGIRLLDSPRLVVLVSSQLLGCFTRLPPYMPPSLLPMRTEAANESAQASSPRVCGWMTNLAFCGCASWGLSTQFQKRPCWSVHDSLLPLLLGLIPLCQHCRVESHWGPCLFVWPLVRAAD